MSKLTWRVEGVDDATILETREWVEPNGAVGSDAEIQVPTSACPAGPALGTPASVWLGDAKVVDGTVISRRCVGQSRWVLSIAGHPRNPEPARDRCDEERGPVRLAPVAASAARLAPEGWRP